MDRVREIFNEWADNGRAEKMEREHSKAVMKYLRTVHVPRRFLDVGCGSGWLVRYMAAQKGCSTAVGIDKSVRMVRSARRQSKSAKEQYVSGEIESWRYRGRFDLVFAMESVYYANSVHDALAAISGLMAPGATLVCGTDFYAENKATRWWAREMKVVMHLMSRAEWRAAFERVGLSARTRCIKNPAGDKKWKREYGTLFVTGTK